MRTRCKFQVEKITKYQGTYEQVSLNAVYDNGEQENASFAAATPSGKLEITVSNPAVVGSFIPGKFYYLDLIPVE